MGAGINIPTLCYDPDLKPNGACRLCVVEIEGMRGAVSSCTTPAADGMVVHTETANVNRARRAALELIFVNHRGDCLTCYKNLHCELQKVAQYLGMKQEKIGQTPQECTSRCRWIPATPPSTATTINASSAAGASRPVRR